MARRGPVVTRTRTRVSVIGGLAVCAALAVLLPRVLAPAPASTAAPPAEPAARPTGGDAAARAAAAAPVTAGVAVEDPAVPAALPGSLAGTEPDGAVTADAAGRLVIDLELRRLFDHFLIATGEEPLATMRARIVAVLRARLPGGAAAEAIEILDRYLAYREAARGLVSSGDLAATLDQLHDLRARMFSPTVATAFFADEEAATHAAIARRDVALDPALSPAEREHRLAELDARLPPGVRAAREAAMAPLQAMAREDALRAAGASDAAIAAARTAALGADAAARLAALDRARAAWDARLAAFRAARAALLADAALDDAERRRRIDELLAGSFTAPERIRVEALDRIDGRGTAAP